MRILYLAHRIPYPPNKGDKIRSFNEIKYLGESHEIDLACLADNPVDLGYKTDLAKYCNRVRVVPLTSIGARVKSMASLIKNKPLSVGYFYSLQLQTTINRWLSANSYDAILCFSSPMAEYIFRCPFLAHRFQHSVSSIRRPVSQIANRKSKIGQPRPPTPDRRPPVLIMDFCDLDSDKWLQYSSSSRFPMSLVYGRESRRLLEYECQVNQYFDHSVFVSQNEADLFLKLYPHARNVFVIPNGVDYEYFSPCGSHAMESTQAQNKIDKTNETGRLTVPSKSNKPRKPDLQLATRNSQPILLFTGAMDYYANVDGVTWFCDKIYPIVKHQFPKAKFYIVGGNPHGKIRSLATNNGIKLTGFVEDIRPYYEAASICVIPLRLARGVQNKVLEAMAMGKPVVTTTKAIEGIHAVSQEQVLVADTPQDFSEAVSRLIDDMGLRKQLGERARQFVTENYTWSTHMKKLEILFHSNQEKKV